MKAKTTSTPIVEQALLRFLRFFASVQLAVILLLTLGATMAAGTFIESAQGTKAAQILIYRAPWFSVLLVILAVNIVASTLTRIPWKLKHVGFVVTHAGILMLLAGSLITQRFVVDGVMGITEGQSENRVSLDEPVIQIVSPQLNIDQVVHLNRHAFDWKGNELLSTLGKQDLSLYELSFYPKAKAEDEIKPSGEGPAALQVHLEGAFVKNTFWLIQDDPESGVVDLGVAKIRFSSQAIENPSAKEPYITFHFPNQELEVPISKASGKFFVLPGTAYQIKIDKTFVDAGVENNQLIERSQEPNNPACQLTLKGKDWSEVHTLFSKYPEFPTMHGLKDSRTGLKMTYHYASSGPQTRELRFSPGPEGALPRAQVFSGQLSPLTPLVFNKNYPTGWNDIQFRIETFYPHAQKNRIFNPVAVNSEEEGAAPALQLALTTHEDSKIFWLQEGDSQTLSANDTLIRVAFGRKTMPLGFSLFLKDFRVKNYPGTDRPASFESDVVLKDATQGVQKEKTISMNEPLEYRGFKIYQSGYQLGQGGPDTSIFSVGRDPGIPLKYIGSIVLVLGSAVFFFTKKFSTSKPLEVTKV